MANVISFFNFKGGVGKSTSTVNVAKALHDKGFKVLVIDADSQGNASRMMGGRNSDENIETLYEVLSGKLDVRNCIIMDQDKEDSFDYIPANYKLVRSETELVSKIGRESVLRKAIQPIQEHYDYILIDCTPTDGLVSQNAISASDYVVIPLNGEPFAVDGMGKIIKRCNEVKENINENLEILGYVFTLMRKCSLHDSIKDRLKEAIFEKNWPGEMFESEIKQNICLAESAMERTNIFDYISRFNGKSIQDRSKRESAIKAANQYKELAEEIISKINR